MTTDIPTEVADPINTQILRVSEDQLQGFQPDPFGQIAQVTGLDRQTITERIVAMLKAGVIRRVRQTLMAINLAPGALVAWVVPEEKLTEAFDWMSANDPFSGHVVVRSTDQKVAAAKYRLWTTLKVPQGYSMDKHCRLLLDRTGCTEYKLLPARRVFALGVGHVRRQGLQIGSKSEEPGQAHEVTVAKLSDEDWRVLVPLKREFEPEELVGDLWSARAAEAGMSREAFFAVARSLADRGVIGRFSTFLEHVKPLKTGEQVTRYNALFHWAVPPGREIDAGRQVGRFHVMTHAYWREGGAEFNGVNIMGVAHGKDKELVLSHKAAIDAHLESVGIPVLYTNVFWGGRSEIKPSEIDPVMYLQWCKKMGVDGQSMKA